MYDAESTSVGIIFVKFCETGRSIVPKTSNVIAKKRIKYVFTDLYDFQYRRHISSITDNTINNIKPKKVRDIPPILIIGLCVINENTIPCISLPIVKIVPLT